MGIAIAIIGYTVVGIACLIGIAVGGYWLLGRVARPEARDTAQLLVWALMAVVAVTAFAWGIQMEARTSEPWQSWEARYCGEAGETIYRTVENVTGVFYEAPAQRPTGGHFHSDETRPEKYLGRPERRYDFFEARFGTEALVQRHEFADGKIVSSRRDAPTARYAFTWTPLESIEAGNTGVHGEELEIYDRETREVLARRVLYYNQSPQRSAAAYGMPLPVCPQVKLRTDPAYIDNQPRDSYDFVARVLKPPALKPEDAHHFSLMRGGGRRVKECVGGYVWIGEGLAPKDLSFEQQGQDLLMTVTGTGDALLCKSYFFSSGGPGKEYRIRFADGGLISGEELRTRLAPEGSKKK